MSTVFGGILKAVGSTLTIFGVAACIALLLGIDVATGWINSILVLFLGVLCWIEAFLIHKRSRRPVVESRVWNACPMCGHPAEPQARECPNCGELRQMPNG